MSMQLAQLCSPCELQPRLPCMCASSLARCLMLLNYEGMNIARGKPTELLRANVCFAGPCWMLSLRRCLGHQT
jgi:hypothetical protein